MIIGMLDECLAAARDADMIIYHPKALAGRHIAEARRIPGILAHPAPLFSPTREFPSPIVPFADLGPWLNRRSHGALVGLTLAFYRSMIGRWRSNVLGLPPAWDELRLFGAPLPRLYGFSRHLLPPPADWDASSYVNGFWFHNRPATWAPPADLARFLEGGPPPVYIGFGSMAAEDAERKAAIAIAALERAGARGILARGAGGLSVANPPPSIHFVDSVPHDWLFERVAAVVHHGGAGTTAAGLRAGLPTVICPFFGDQPFWGRLVAAAGLGSQPIPQKRLTIDNLAQAIGSALNDGAMRRRAAEIGRRIRAEDGVGQAVAWIEERVGVTINAD
jgi:UDP:flavonoid glycosyltransferase YjiC (YdhE family)